MTRETIYALLVLVIILILAILFWVLKKQNLLGQLRPFTIVALFLVFFGLFLQSHPTLSCSLISIGILLSLVDIVNRYRHPNKDDDNDLMTKEK